LRGGSHLDDHRPMNLEGVVESVRELSLALMDGK
jgi:hypothetical protein